MVGAHSLSMITLGTQPSASEGISLCINTQGMLYFLSRTYELKVHGGTPFESGIELDASNIKGMELE